MDNYYENKRIMTPASDSFETYQTLSLKSFQILANF